MGSLLDDMDRKSFMTKVRSALLKRISGGGQRIMAGPTAGPMGMMSSSLPTAQESTAFNERIRDKAVYGSYGKGGIERERIVATTLNELANRQMTPKDRADIELKKREQELREKGKWNWKPDPFGEGEVEAGSTSATGIEGSPAQEKNRPGLSGERIGGVPTPQATPPALKNSVRDAAPRTGGTYTVDGKTYQMPGEYDPSGSFLPSKQPAPKAPAPAAAGQTLADSVPLPSRMDPEMWEGYDAPTGERQTPTNEKQVSRRDAETQKGQTEQVPGLAETVMQVIADMFVRAPKQAIGEENISAAGNTLADMIWRAPGSEIVRGGRQIGRGADWLSRQALGGLR